jgi:hypothetical protein
MPLCSSEAPVAAVCEFERTAAALDAPGLSMRRRARPHTMSSATTVQFVKL